MTVDELREFGMERMDEKHIQEFLSSKGTGVLALPTERAPYVIPMSFGYDGGTRLFFTYIAADDSRKLELSEGDEPARFLAYSVESAFNWRSVVLTGSIEEVPQSEWGEHADAMDDNAWHPDLIETVLSEEAVEVYVFNIEDWDGFTHQGIPPGFQEQP